jgi:hypothetical protein
VNLAILAAILARRMFRIHEVRGVRLPHRHSQEAHSQEAKTLLKFLSWDK